jgi:hypothetical protein
MCSRVASRASPLEFLMVQLRRNAMNMMPEGTQKVLEGYLAAQESLHI